MKLYAVRNKEGKFFRSKGYGYNGNGGSGDSWVDTLDRAKLYSKIGQARGRVTFFYKAWPNYGCPDILEFEINVEKAIVMPMEEATAKKIKSAEAKRLKRELADKEYQRKRLLEEQQRITDKLKNL